MLIETQRWFKRTFLRQERVLFLPTLKSSELRDKCPSNDPRGLLIGLLRTKPLDRVVQRVSVWRSKVTHWEGSPIISTRPHWNWRMVSVENTSLYTQKTWPWCNVENVWWSWLYFSHGRFAEAAKLGLLFWAVLSFSKATADGKHLASFHPEASSLNWFAIGDVCQVKSWQST